MKNTIYKLTAKIFLAAIIIAGCESPATKVENAKGDLRDAKEEYSQAYKDSIADYNAFKTSSEERIASNEIAINAFKERMKTDSKKIKANDQKVIDELEQKNINMRKKIEEYKETGKDEWAEFKKEFSHDMDELGNALKDLTVKNTK